MITLIKLEAWKKKVQDFQWFLDLLQKSSLDDLLIFSAADYLNRTKKLRIKRKTDALPVTANDAANITQQIFLGCFKSQYVGGGTAYDAIVELKEHTESYADLYQRLDDERSKVTYHYVLLFKFFGDQKYFRKSHTSEIEYYLPELLSYRENAVFADCGACDGQTVINYAEVYGSGYKRIYAYEPVPENFAVVQEALRDMPNVVCRNAGVADKQGEMRFTSHMPNTANRIHPMGDKVVDIVTLDEDIKEKIDFIKMDIESAEPDALEGAKRHIIEDRPNLAICVYHTISDLRVIFEKIVSYNPDQRFNLRHHNQHNCEEIVLYGESRNQKDFSDVVEENEEEVEESFEGLGGEGAAGIENIQQLQQIYELVQTIGEGVAYVGARYQAQEYSACQQMLEEVEMAMTICQNKIAVIKEELAR